MIWIDIEEDSDHKYLHKNNRLVPGHQNDHLIILQLSYNEYFQHNMKWLQVSFQYFQQGYARLEFLLIF